MGLQNEEVTGQETTCAISDQIGASTHWKTYSGRTDDGEPTLIRVLQGEVPDSSHDRFNGLVRQWASISDRESVRGVIDWGTEIEPWVAVEYASSDGKQFASGGMVDTAIACDDRTKVELVSEVCETIQTYSRYGSTSHHLAIHPDCLFFGNGQDGPVAIVDDWGVSRLVNEPPITPYTAPEQLEDGGHAKKRTDIYQVGVLATHLLTGTTPFADDADSDDPEALASTIENGIDETVLPEGTVEPISKAMAVDPEDRYSALSQFQRDLLNAVPASTDRATGSLIAVTTPTLAATNTGERQADTTGSPSSESTTAVNSPTETATTSSQTDTASTRTDTTNARPDRTGTGNGNSRRSFLKYGVVAVGGAGAMYLGLPILTGDESLRSALPGGTTGSDPAAGSGGDVRVNTGFRSWLEPLENNAENVGIPREADVQIQEGPADPAHRVDELINQVESDQPQPDLFVVNETELGMLMEATVTDSMGEHSIDETLRNTPPLYEALSQHPSDGVHHAIPYGFMPLVVAYHKPLLREMGYDNGVFEAWMTDPPSWEQWSEISAFAREMIGTPFGFIWPGQPTQLPGFFTSVLEAFGGTYYGSPDAATGPITDRPVTIANPQAVEATNVIHDLVTGDNRSSHAIEQCTSDDIFSMGFNQVYELLMGQEAVAAQIPLSLARILVEEYGPDEVGIMPMPTGTARSATTAFGSYVAMNPNTENTGGALEVASAFRSPEFAQMILSQGYEIPFGEDIQADGLFDSSLYEPYADTFQFIAGSPAVEPAGNAWIDERDVIGEQMVEAVMGFSPEPILEQLAEFIDHN
ncbi:hypothetical protein [Halostagnicola sp. A-GB9-2]|uniref:hypothetical protein n=1 Tax=Halostagnicola sp. A-GB9-2 TaxID=3048066 RepID=UPI0024C089D6|nr:hypothetical protein [Halostagnicola sp. A-GB9-2]MDJ1434271.1 hypothetical protein [Halostagnicola sp. A-GB9-2]